MDESEIKAIKKIIEDLDKRVAKDDARVQFGIYGGGPDEGMVQANQKGYLRLGIEFLKAAFAPPSENVKDPKNAIDVDINYLTTGDSPISFDWFERREDIPPPPKPGKPGGVKDCLSLLGCGILLFILMFIFIMGIVSIFGLLK